MDLPADLCVDGEIDKESGLLCGLPEDISEARKHELTQAFTVNKWKWWYISPIDQLDNTKEDESTRGREVVKGMLKCIYMRRGMDTILQLPDHSDGSPWYVSPRDGIPPHHIETHALSYAALKPMVDKFMNDHFQDLAVSSGAAGPQSMAVTLSHGAQVQATLADEGGDDDGGNLDISLLRILNIASADFLSVMAMIREDAVAQMPADVVLEELVNIGEASGGPQRARKHIRDASHSQGVLTFGSAHTEAIMQGTGDFGLSYLQLLALGDDPYDFIPVERKSVLSRVLARSPVNTHVLALCCRRATEKERTLVMVSTPWQQLTLFAIMKKASLNVLSVRAGMTAAEKASAFSAFNDPTTNVNVLLLNTMVGAAGLNLHHSCNFGIQVQVPWSYGSSGQYLGRLVRLRQTKPVTWVILTVNDTAYNFLEHRACLKEVQALSATLKFGGPHLNTPFSRKLLSYEVLRVFWSQPFNRMTWEHAHPQHIQDFTSENSRTFGQFYSLLSSLLLETEKADLPDDWADILSAASSLKMALPLAYLKHCNGMLPEQLTWDEMRTVCDSAQSDPDVQEQTSDFTPTNEFGTVSKFKQHPLFSVRPDDDTAEGSGHQAEGSGHQAEGSGHQAEGSDDQAEGSDDQAENSAEETPSRRPRKRRSTSPVASHREKRPRHGTADALADFLSDGDEVDES
ncbi:hypothetical protein KVR01_008670 [Diaporthe batatas]|uniref:uncharacterized protein n=1 Tax=Diaporthe batatas TaxID=748121 RepID=UPI001D043328|nr:uncharacterized protein KVR01_008670 [Diaporthe batatas]KAG8161683.1 hypothetical protein KVR01_008670 [Diaporthe batatas]